MFAKLAALAVVAPLVSALTISPLTGATTGGQVTITWTASTTDAAYFSIELVNKAFNNEFAIANNVQTSTGSLSITLPQVPVGDGYSLEAIATNDVNTIYSQSGDFSVGAATTSSSTASSTTASSSTASTSSSTGTVSSPSVTATSPTSSGATAAASTGAGTTASSTASPLSSGAGSVKVAGVLPAAALVLSAVAGVAMVF